MTRIGLGMTCEGPVSVFPGGSAGLSTFAFNRDQFRIALRDVSSGECDRALDTVERLGIRIVASNFAIELPGGAWTRPDDSWVGAVLDAGDVAALEPGHAFDPPLPPPCLGRVPPGLPIRVTRRPSGDVAGVRCDTIVSRRMSAFLAGYAGLERGPVVVRGVLSPDWFRLFPADRRAVIDSGVLREFTCRACGTPGVTDPGVWIGRRVTDVSVCRDACGVGHLAAPRHPFVLSTDVARSLEARFKANGHGYRLLPVLDVEGDDGRRVLGLLGRLRRLHVA